MAVEDMKYYRTKDGRIIKESDIPDYWGGLVTVVGLDLDYKVAYNLEELCDEFVSVDKEDGHHSMCINGKPSYSKYCDIYGAIWTQRGLIFVAKLNEKWELELL